jgi:lipid A 3-O-deacylase
MSSDVLTSVSTCVDRRTRRLLLALWTLSLLLCGSPTHAQTPTPGRDDSAAVGPQSLTFLFENDLFGDSDAQYTNGLKLSWLSPDLKTLKGARGLPQWLHDWVARLNAFERRVTGDNDCQFNIGFGIGQMMFTPDDTQARALVVDDRPYAGWLYGALTLVSKTREVADTLEIQAGMVGSASLAEQAQKFVHDIRDLPTPRGWGNQLDNEPGLLVCYERKWRLIRRPIHRALEYDAIAHAGLALGNIADYGALGGEFRLGWNLPHDFGTSLIRPGGDGNAPTVASNYEARGRNLGIYGFAAFGGRTIARDIFLDGNTFSDSHDVGKKHFVGDLLIGARVVWGTAKVSYAQVFRTREFDGQKRHHDFGSISVSFSL